MAGAAVVGRSANDRIRWYRGTVLLWAGAKLAGAADSRTLLITVKVYVWETSSGSLNKIRKLSTPD
jgi:hypothetical protein